MPTWETISDWDGGQSSTGIHHEQPTGTDWAAANTVEKGYPSVFSELSGTVVAYWPLAEDSGASTANDVSGYATTYDGTYNGTAVNTGGPFGKQYRSFDQNDDYIDTGHNFSLSKFSVNAWFRINGWNTTYENIINNWDGNAASGSIQRNASNNELYSGCDGKSIRGGDSSADPSDGNWHFATVAWDTTSSKGDIYLDGQSDGNGTGNTLDETVGANHWIGSEPSGGGGNFWGGDIAHVFITDHQMPQSEHTDLYNAVL